MAKNFIAQTIWVYTKELGMGIEPTKIGYLLARVKLPISGDASSQKSFFAASSPFFLFSNTLFPKRG